MLVIQQYSPLRAVFFCVFMIHIAWCVWSAIAPQFGGLEAGAAHTGFLPAIGFVQDAGGGNTLAGVIGQLAKVAGSGVHASWLTDCVHACVQL